MPEMGRTASIMGLVHRDRLKYLRVLHRRGWRSFMVGAALALYGRWKHVPAGCWRQALRADSLSLPLGSQHAGVACSSPADTPGTEHVVTYGKCVGGRVQEPPQVARTRLRRL